MLTRILEIGSFSLIKFLALAGLFDAEFGELLKPFFTEVFKSQLLDLAIMSRFP